jgi:hypothetical protein
VRRSHDVLQARAATPPIKLGLLAQEEVDHLLRAVCLARAWWGVFRVCFACVCMQARGRRRQGGGRRRVLCMHDSTTIVHTHGGHGTQRASCTPPTATTPLDVAAPPTHPHPHPHTPTHPPTHTYTHPHPPTPTHPHTLTHTHPHTHPLSHTHIHTHTHTHPHPHPPAPTPTHTHTPTHPRERAPAGPRARVCRAL